MARKTLFVTLLAVCLFTLGGAAVADPLYPYYTDVNVVQTGGPFITSLGGGYNQWDTPLMITNTGANTEQIWFVWDSSQSRDTDGSLNDMTYNNGTGNFEYTDSNGAFETAGPINDAFYMSLDPGTTNIPIPPGLTTSDSVPAFYVGILGAGQSVNIDIDQKLTDNMFEFYFNGSFVANPVPEPSSLLLFGSGLAGLSGLLRRKLRK